MVKCNNKYSLEQFVKDCKLIGWRDGKASPAWMDNLDLEPTENDLERVLTYREDPNHIATIMDFWKERSGVRFGIEYMSRGEGQGFVTNKEDLFTYMKVVGYDKGIRKNKKIQN